MATVSMPNSRHARITRSAISPRLATRMRLNIARWTVGGGRWTARQTLLPPVDLEERLSKLHGLAIVHEHGHDLSRYFGGQFVEDLHGFNDANRGFRSHVIADLDERRRLGIGRQIKRADHGAFNHSDVLAVFGAAAGSPSSSGLPMRRSRGRLRWKRSGRSAQRHATTDPQALV